MATKTTTTRRSWDDNWSWKKLIRSLSDGNPETQLQVARRLWRLQLGSFQQLREAFAHPEHQASWQKPFLYIEVPFPFEWDTEIPISQVTARKHRKRRELFVALETLTAGIAVQIDGDTYRPLLPQAVRNRLDGFSKAEVSRCLESWIDPQEWIHPTSYGDNNLGDVDDRTIIGIGKERDFMASLWFHVFPRFINYEKRESYFLLSVGLPWLISEHSTMPQDWTAQEQDALWSNVDAFFQKLIRVRKLSNLPEKIVTEVQPAEGTATEFERFEASFRNHRDVSFLEKTQLRPIEETPLRGIPQYAVGSAGPELDISDGKGNLDPMAMLKILAVMVHPDSEQHRQEVLSKAQAWMISEYLPRWLAEEGRNESFIKENWGLFLEQLHERLGWLSSDVFGALVSAPSAEDTIARMGSNMFGGAVTGDMLLYMLRCAEHHPKHLSVRKAAYAMARTLLGSTDRAGNPVNYGLSTVKNSWGKYRSVAHLWAAYRLWQAEDQPSEFSPVDPEGVVGFLAISEELRRRGQACFARSQKLKHGPILDPSITWRPPFDLALPSATLDNSPLPEETLDWLEEYSCGKTAAA